ncbi:MULTISPECIES: MFS transporter [Rhodococcus]|uniref:Putative proline/betaine transporter n=1 Tax=Rhodococcus oxybenzonivorans TaxID=1990687 RepID=A0AAE4UVB5_9NOCA|nr:MULTISPECIES: MFS transporter [Rhodococcus]MDV7245588.1 MFS transporter [Rhodococcus oxybenzonivorans]MDV7263389.1 MFS transporter [Rhodococcus oxybenzonivorans]MDV7276668.1 MFS transporter [Rhodococcus oxybenzonivorans]MDV7336405.1 MFS transporter [Rhodococcus oxybenzonivorans]MDV7346736.1 MFS transporter [Rhodococcus oxybenzonivorans]
MSTVSTSSAGVPHTPAPVHKGGTSVRKVAVASGIGTTIEFYDFFIYGTAAALVFPKVFFPALGSTAGTVASFATFAVAFVARPVGAMLFGHYGDRIGRKKTLVSTLILMGVSTFLIGLLPGAATIGVAAPILLVLLRFGQGFAVGGEWAGATLLTAEYAPPGKRGLYAMFPQLGPAVAFILSSATFLVTGAVFGDTNSTFLDYGWRIPFLFSAVLVGIGLYMRLAIEETPVFRAVQEADRADVAPRTLPLMDAWRYQTKEILLSAGALATLFAFFYMGTAFLTSYGTATLGFSRPFVLTVGIVSAVVFGLTIIVSALYSDRIGRRRVIMISCALAVVWALALFPLLDTGSPVAFAVGVMVTLAIFGVAYGPCGALLPEMFQTRYRYTGAGLGYNLAGVLGGAVPPLIAAPLASAYGSAAIGVMLAGLAVVSLVCTKALVETKDEAL